MASEKNPLSKFPQEVRSGIQPSSPVYTRLPDRYAVHGPRPPSKDALLSMGEGEDRIEIFRGEAEQQKNAPGQVGPVYTLQPGGTPAVPSGRVFIRFKEGVPVERRLREIEQAGYEVVQRLDYAPHAAWLRARSGEIADALTRIPALEQIADVENVEPQMLMQRANR
ncbi:hypothetical protein [Candidatus Manganitrophus noduliformans]|uniref:Uncharacterized protein n=1 Tax=Candidatus Manganitrophus noduliformans TaxID=2606439 RepID=A0A7X6I9J9_9BACT|nr:hypothetical protein [Candidatus Manganitrophus noduliformans]NKE69548.1 hypothetical protein [Candidatus Manganitrophus noduliformans]